MELKGPLPQFVSPIKVFVLGFLTILASLSFYQSILYYYPVQTRSIGFLRETAYFVLALMIVGLLALFIGATLYFRQPRVKNFAGSFSRTMIMVSSALNDKASFRVFVLSALVYGLLFGFLSSSIAYRPAGVLSEGSSVNIPSSLAILCCGDLGQMPQFVIYLSQQFAIFVIPINLVLLVTVSWLVGLNAGMGMFAYKNRPDRTRGKWLWGFGAIVGLFSACPSCAGFFLLTMLGLTGAIGLTLTLASLQGAFIAVGLPILLITPILTSRRIPSYQECLIKPREPMKTGVNHGA